MMGIIMEDRWSLPDLTTALEWCRERDRQHIHCILAAMAEFARTPEDSQHSLKVNRTGIRMAGDLKAGIAFSLKPSAIGILFDREEYVRNLSLLFHEARDCRVPFEIDMEGRPYVESILQSVLDLASEGTLTLALQAYLERTSRDLPVCLKKGVTVRLVKGAYTGDTDDFTTIQKQFRTHAETLISAGISFSAATHDPELIDWLREKMSDRKDLIEFSFLKGLAERTKIGMAADGWKIAEYVPYGAGGEAYIMRRKRYLETLENLGRAPAP
jgi:proline dehydrogenase